MANYTGDPDRFIVFGKSYVRPDLSDVARTGPINYVTQVEDSLRHVTETDIVCLPWETDVLVLRRFCKTQDGLKEIHRTAKGIVTSLDINVGNTLGDVYSEIG